MNTAGLLSVMMSSALTANLFSADLSAKISLAVPNHEMAAKEHDETNVLVKEYIATASQRMHNEFTGQKRLTISGATTSPLAANIKLRGLIFDQEMKTIIQSTITYQGQDTQFTISKLASIAYLLEVNVSQPNGQVVGVANELITPTAVDSNVEIDIGKMVLICGKITNQDVYSVIDPILIYGGLIQTVKNNEAFSIQAHDSSAHSLKVWFSRRVQHSGSKVIYEFIPQLSDLSNPSNEIHVPDLGVGAVLDGKLILSSAVQGLWMHGFVNLAAVNIRAIDSNLSAITHADDEGSFRIEGLPPGRYEATLERPILGMKIEKAAFVIQPSQTTTINIHVDVEK